MKPRAIISVPQRFNDPASALLLNQLLPRYSSHGFSETLSMDAFQRATRAGCHALTQQLPTDSPYRHEFSAKAFILLWHTVKPTYAQLTCAISVISGIH